MTMENPRRPIRVTQAPATQPAMPPTGSAGVATSASMSSERWAQQVRMSALHAAAKLYNNGAAFPLGTPVLVVARWLEHYILTGKAENPEESQT